MYYSDFKGNISIEINLNPKGVLMATADARRYFLGEGLLQDIAELVRDVLKNVHKRFEKSAATTDWGHPDLDVNIGVGHVQRYYQVLSLTHLRRIAESVGLANKIKEKIDMSPPIGDFRTGIFFGIGNINELDAIKTVPYKDKSISLWRVLEFGTGIHNILGGKPYLVTPGRNPMVFWFARHNRWVAFKKPILHPGQIGRHYFLSRNLDFHSEDKNVLEQIPIMFNRRLALFSRR